MATVLYLRNTQNNAIGGTYYDLITTAGASVDTAIVNTTASGTEIQFTKTAGGSLVQFISGRVPSGGFTLTTGSVSLWLSENNMNANIGGRVRIFKRAAGGTETELGGGPFNFGTEMSVTTPREDVWTTNVTDTAFAENDRILLKVYITNVGVMATGFTGELRFNAAAAATGDSFLSISENVTFKGETVDTPATGTATGSGTAAAAAMRGRTALAWMYLESVSYTHLTLPTNSRV